jgi:hypothetical protein
MGTLMTLLRMMTAAAAALMLAGCLPVTTKTPVGTTTGLKADPALYGTWKGYDPKGKDDTPIFFHFFKGKADRMQAAMVQAAGAKDDGITAFDITTASLGKNRFINAVITDDKGTPADAAAKSFPVLYTLKGRTLTLYLVDEDKATEAVKTGKIKGTIDPGVGGDVTITEDAKELDALMAKPEAKNIFRLLVSLKKVD